MSQAATRTIEGVEAPAAGTWKFDHDHTKLSAVARHMMVTKVRGYFNDVSGTIKVAERPEDSSVEVTIQAASIDTGVQQRDDHLRSADFMDVEHFPTITFKSTRIEHVGGPNLRVTGTSPSAESRGPSRSTSSTSGWRRRPGATTLGSASPPPARSTGRRSA